MGARQQKAQSRNETKTRKDRANCFDTDIFVTETLNLTQTSAWRRCCGEGGTILQLPFNVCYNVIVLLPYLVLGVLIRKLKDHNIIDLNRSFQE